MIQDQSDTTETITYDNPYVGPESFARDDDRPFEGRGRETKDLAALLIARRLVLFYAESGAGKTSLINAGLTPLLENTRNFEVLPVTRVSGAIPAGVAPDNVFAYSLMVDVDQSGQGPERFAELRLTDFLLDTVRVGEKYVYVADDGTLEQHSTGAGDDATVAATTLKPRALFIDQFEELFTTHTGADAPEARAAFFRQLAEAMADDPRLYVMLSMRADYVHHLNRYVHLLPDGLRTRYYMSRMRPKAARKAVKQPAKEAGRPFAAGVAEELVAHLQRERVQGSDNGDEQWVPGETVEPIQLQVVCLQLWQSLGASEGDTITRDDLTRVARRALGEEEQLDDPLTAFVGSALGGYYEQSLTQALQVPNTDVSEEYLRDWFSHKLITAAGTRGFLLRGEADTAGVPEAVITALENRYLIRSETRAGSKWVELIHDSFIEPVQDANEAWNKEQMQDKPWMAAADRWEKRGRPAHLLSRDDLLAVALEEAGDLSSQPQPVRDFLRESRQAQMKREKEEEEKRADAAEATNRKLRQQQDRLILQRVGLLALIMITVIALGIAGWLFIREQEKSQELEAKTTELEANQIELTKTIGILRTNEFSLSETITELNETQDQLEATSLARDAQRYLEEQNYIGALLLSVAADERESGIAEEVLLPALDGIYAREGISGTFRIEATAPLSVTQLFAGPRPGALTAYNGEQLLAWEPTTNSTHTMPISGTPLAATADGTVLATVDADDNVSVWRAPFTSPQLLALEAAQRWDVNAAAFDADQSRLALIRCAEATNEDDSEDDNQETGIRTQTVSGRTDEESVWSFEGQEGDEVVIAMNSPDGDIDAYLRLLDEAGEEVAWDDDGGVGFNSRLEFELPASGRYLISAETFSSDQGRYELTLTAPSGYDLTRTGVLANVTCQLAMAMLDADDTGELEETVMFDSLEGIRGNVETLAFLDERTLILVDKAGAVATLPLQSENAGDEAITVRRLDNIPDNQYTTELLVVPGRGRLLTAGCRTTGTICENIEGFVQWWSVAESELSRIGVALALPSSVTALAPVPGSESTQVAALTAAKNTTVIWQTAQSTWPQLACAAAGRNLTYAEWEQALDPISLGYEDSRICDQQDKQAFDYGLDLSFALHEVAECDLDEAQKRATMASESRSTFTAIALQTTIEKVLAEPSADSDCIDQIVSLIGDDAPEPEDVESLLLNIRDWSSNPPTEAEVDAVYETITGWPHVARDALSGRIVGEYEQFCPLGTATVDLESNACQRFRSVLTESYALDDSSAPRIGDTSAEESLWSFTGDADDFVSIFMNGLDDGVDTYLTLLDESGVELERDDDGGEGLNSRLDYMLPVTGTYFVRAESIGAQGRYELALIRREPAVLHYGQIVAGSTDEQALWTFAAESGDVVSISMNGLDENVDASLVLLDENGYELVWADYGGEGADARLVDYILPDSDTYFVRAESVGAQGRYELALIRREPAALSDGQTVEGHTDERSLWMFAGEGDDVVSISMNGLDEDVDAYLTLLDETGYELTWADSGGEGTDARLVDYILPDNGTYFVRATSTWEPGRYELTLSRQEPVALNYGQTVEASTDEQSLWTFAGQTGEIVSINMNSIDERVEPSLTLLDENGAEMAWADYPDDGTSIQLNYLPPYSGTFFVRATSTWEPGRYELTLSRQEPVALNYGQTVEASTDEQSLWTFAGERSDIVSISMNGLDEGVDAYLTLLDENGVELEGDDDGGEGLNSQLDYNLPDSSTYFVRAESISAQGRYELTLIRQEPVALTSGQTVEASTSEQSLWAFAGDQGNVVSISMNGLDDNVDAYLTLMDETGYELTWADYSGEGTDARLDYILPISGTYFVRAESTWEPGRYELTLDRLEPPTLTTGQVVTGTTTTQIFWAFEGTAGDAVTVELNGANENFDPYLTLFDPQGAIIAENDDSGEGYLGYDARIHLQSLPESGRYIIRVGRGGSSEPYTLTLTSIDQNGFSSRLELRQEWIAALEDGEDPFNEETLLSLLIE